MRYLYKPVFTFLLAGSLALGGCQTTRKADRHFENFDYALAIDEYQEAFAGKEPKLKGAQRLADSYRLTRQTVKAEEWYAKVVAMPEADPVNIFYYAEALRSNGKYFEAKTQYQNYAMKVPAQAAMANAKAQACDAALKLLEEPATAIVVNETAINSGNADFSPTPYQNGIIFASDRGGAASSGKDKEEGTYGWTGRPFLQMFYAQRNEDSTWQLPVMVDESLNSKYHDGTAAVDSSNTTLYFTRTNMVKVKNKNINTDPTSWVKKPLSNDYVNRLEIYSAQQDSGKWSNVKPFEYNKVTEYSVGHPALSPDGQVMYFVSDKPGGYGETDIYYTEKQADGSWGQPVNAGSTINTVGKEMFPAFDQQGNLYFSSDTHSGFGGLDVFRAKGSRSTWSKPENLRAPVNSPKDDFGLAFMPNQKNELVGYMSSNRDSNNGTDDIYSFKLLSNAVLLVTTLERIQMPSKKSTTQPLPDVRLKLAIQGTTDSTIAFSDRNGEYLYGVMKGNIYELMGEKFGYLSQSATVNIDTTSLSDTTRVTLIFDKSTVNQSIVIENIYYDLDKWNIRPDAAAELNKLVRTLKDNPSIKIELGAHTDSREGQGYNQLLSERRAQSAVEYLVSQGIARNRLTWRGYGETRLVNKCADGVECPEDMHQMNRRTEFKIK
ncbi:OmpA family protein [Rufibacter quisquiliarum]|uniref:Outer membrane protein OmpA-like peptidoglycan-associated protein n=1 Tax=Rufibacter quisquiliarum TaxID=1549639 RepID=A0A839GRS6_9BACT|nr:OmpA family protein [Rufibacter quisquiliarum]MBA9077577.1 outer membrane protein OmpA-like peptidoglycan-associated protein [Rufibacter quisquiliarum]